MKERSFISAVQRKVANTAVGPSTVRGQGKGVARASRAFLAEMQLARIPRRSQSRFGNWLDRQTEALLDALPVENRPWGTSRKVINIFLRDLLYNQYLDAHLQMYDLEPWLEAPLDGIVAKELKARDERGELPAWPGLKWLTAEVNEQYQDFASRYARTINTVRVHLDMYLWVKNR